MSAVKSMAKISLIGVMAVGSVVLWLGLPVLWLWIGSLIQSGSQQPGFTPYVVVLVGLVVSMVVFGRLLSRTNALYEQVTGTAPEVRVRMPWHRSMRGDDDSRPPRRVLDVVMVTSVTLAMIVFLVWFLFFAGSSLPTS